MRYGRLFRHVGQQRHTRDQDVDPFTADDLIATKLLSVQVPTAAAITLLRDRADEFATILADVGPDRDLVDEIDLLDDNWPGWRLMRELRGIGGVGPTIASKLFAANGRACARSGSLSSPRSPTLSQPSGNRFGWPCARTTRPFIAVFCT